METRTYDYIMVQLASGEEQMWGGGENKVKALSSYRCLLLLFELWHSRVVRSLASNTTWYNKLIGLSCH